MTSLSLAGPTAHEILEKTGISGGLIVHVGCGDGQFTAALRAGDHYLVQGLDRDPEKVALARATLKKKGLYGKVTVDPWQGQQLPYIENLVDLLAISSPASVAREPHGPRAGPRSPGCLRRR